MIYPLSKLLTYIIQHEDEEEYELGGGGRGINRGMFKILL
jgi:hypothetical protein